MTIQPVDEQNRFIATNNIVFNEIDEELDTPPVDPVEAASGVLPAQPVGVADEIDTTPVDLAQVSMEARGLVQDARRNPASEYRAASASEYLQTANSPSVTQLRQTFQNYDNSAAVSRFNNYLNIFTRFGVTQAAAEEQEAEMNLRTNENALYRYLGISNYGAQTREARLQMALAVDRWIAGEGVFLPEMLSAASSDGFRFTPITAEAELARRNSEVLASYNREQIAAYLREMALLRPEDFLFYDTTGLDQMELEERRRFLALMDQLLLEANARALAADLNYRSTTDGSLDIDYLEEQLNDEQQRLIDALNQQRDNYGQLISMYERYVTGTVSASLA